MGEIICTDYLKRGMLENFKREMILPDKQIKRLDDLGFEEISNMGIRAIILDFDNTLGAHGSYHVDKSLQEYLKALSDNFYLRILSNAGARRKSMIEIDSTIGVVRTVPKPHSKAFKDAWKELTAEMNRKENTYRPFDRSEIAMIDDRLGGISGGNRAGWYTIKVEPLYPESDPAPIRLARRLEERLLKYYDQRLKYHLTQSASAQHDAFAELKR